MDKRTEKSFMRINSIILISTMLMIGVVTYLIKDMEWWQTMICLFIILVCSFICNLCNFIFHVRKK
jgi:hypothetical protein